MEDLRKQGIAPLPKPPPGVGLLPTPGSSSPQDNSQGGKKIPSLFEIKVQPTMDLAQKIGLGYLSIIRLSMNHLMVTHANAYVDVSLCCDMCNCNFHLRVEVNIF